MLRTNIQQSQYDLNRGFVQINFEKQGDLEDAKRLIEHLEERSRKNETFCLIFNSTLATQWSEEAETYFHNWWIENQDRLANCQALGFVANTSRRSRLLTEFLLSKKYATPCKCFRNSSHAKTWAEKQTAL